MLSTHTDILGPYKHTEDLLAMDAMRPVQDVTDPRLGLNSTPLNLPAWAEHLRQHPDWAFVQYLQGISHGFRIGYDWAAPRLSASRNMASADEHPAVIQAYIDEECELGRIMGPFRPGDLQPEVHISRSGIIPKKHQKGKWRMIVDLSHPQGRSINDGIFEAVWGQRGQALSRRFPNNRGPQLVRVRKKYATDAAVLQAVGGASGHPQKVRGHAFV